MNQIKMHFGSKVETFKITYECPDYVFCECETNPSARGFFTRAYIDKNKAYTPLTYAI